MKPSYRRIHTLPLIWGASCVIQPQATRTQQPPSPQYMHLLLIYNASLSFSQESLQNLLTVLKYCTYCLNSLSHLLQLWAT